MSHVVVVEKNKDGKIEFTKDELQKMLDEAYNQGYSDGKATRWDTITYPSSPWYATTYTTTSSNMGTSDKITLNGADVSSGI